MKHIKHPTPIGGTIVFALAIVSTLFSKSLAQTPEERGLQIAIEVDQRDSGFGDLTANMIMILRNRHGEESVRDMKIRTLEVKGDGDKSLTTFNTPRDIKGTSFLSYTHVTGPDDQWLYLPALKRVKRISSNNKSGPFMGSEFAYEDLSSQEVDKYTYKYITDDSANGLGCFVVERYPVDKNSGYTRQLVWFDKDEYRPQKIEYYDRKDALLKTLVYSEYHQHLDRYWRAYHMTMENHQTGKSTTLKWSEMKFQVGLSKRDFDRKALKRTR